MSNREEKWKVLSEILSLTTLTIYVLIRLMFYGYSKDSNDRKR